MKTYVQYGCGFDAPDGWINYDASPTLLFERIPFFGRLYTRNEKRFPQNVIWGDIVRGLPHGKESVRGIYCSHILEHLSLEDCRKAISNTYDYLVPGGIFRLVVPDLELAMQEYRKELSSEAANLFMKSTMLGTISRGNFARRMVDCVFGNSKHQWMWDEKAMIQELKNAGFRQVRRAKYGDSADKKFSEAEREGRFVNSLALEAIK